MRVYKKKKLIKIIVHVLPFSVWKILGIICSCVSYILMTRRVPTIRVLFLVLFSSVLKIIINKLIG